MRGDFLPALVNEAEVVVVVPTNARLTRVISSTARNLLMNEISPDGRDDRGAASTGVVEYTAKRIVPALEQERSNPLF